MNCKQGDLAIAVGGKNNCGAIMRCLRLATREDFKRHGVRFDSECWVVDRENVLTDRFSGWSGSAPLAPDCFLRPIRGGEGDDETLTWAGKPQEVTA